MSRRFEMTDTEYAAITEKIAYTFPALASWFLRLPMAGRQAQRERRKATLIDLEARDVNNAITDFSIAPVAPWAGFGQEEWAYGHIAKRAKEFAESRAGRRDVPIGRGAYQPIQGLKSIREQAEQLVELKKQPDWTHDDTRDWLDKEIPPDTEDRRERWSCLPCHDTGLVPCLASIRMVKGEIVFTQGSKACHCQLGRTFSERRDESTRITPYDECEHVKLPFGIISGEEAQALLLATRERRANRNRNPGFDQYNDEQAARQF